MITEKDLQEAIAECQGERNPNANTCIKLAAFYIIRQHMFDKPSNQLEGYSYNSGPHTAVDTTYTSDTEFFNLIKDKDLDEILSLMDETMTTLMVVNPNLYNSIIRRLS